MSRNRNGLLALMSFVAIMCVGLALLIAAIVGRTGGGIFTVNSFETALFLIANVIAYTVISIFAFFFANAQRGNMRVGCLIAWTVAITMIIVSLVLNLV